MLGCLYGWAHTDWSTCLEPCSKCVPPLLQFWQEGILSSNVLGIKEGVTLKNLADFCWISCMVSVLPFIWLIKGHCQCKRINFRQYRFLIGFSAAKEQRLESKAFLFIQKKWRDNEIRVCIRYCQSSRSAGVFSLFVLSQPKYDSSNIIECRTMHSEYI